jgi:hypothetical protein
MNAEITETTITKACANCGEDFTTRQRDGVPYRNTVAAAAIFVFTNDSSGIKTCITSVWQLIFSKNRKKRFLASTKQSAKVRGLLFDLSEAWFKGRLDRGVCEVTGLPVRIKLYKKGDAGQRSFYNPSVDRVDNALGYIPSNCRLVCWGYNLAKHDCTDRDLNTLAISLLIQSLPPGMKDTFLAVIPPVLLASLPSGQWLF